MGSVRVGVGEAPGSRRARGTRARRVVAGRDGTRSCTPPVEAAFLVLVSLVGTTACGTPVTAVSSPAAGAAASAQSGATGPGQSGTGATTTGPGTAASPTTSRPATARPCRSGDLSFTIENASFAIDRSQLMLRATNDSSSPCELDTRPVIQLEHDGEDLHVVTVDALEGRSAPAAPSDSGAGGDTATPVVLLPGESSVSVLEWRAQQWSGDAGTEVLRAAPGEGLGDPVTATQGENLPGPSPIRVNGGDPVAAGHWSAPRTGRVPGDW